MKLFVLIYLTCLQHLCRGARNAEQYRQTDYLCSDGIYLFWSIGDEYIGVGTSLSHAGMGSYCCNDRALAGNLSIRHIQALIEK